MLDAGVVDQDVDGAEFGLAGTHHGLDLGRPGHVGAVVADAPAQPGHVRLGAFHVAEAVEQDVGALAGQLQGDAQANAAGGAGDKRCLAFEHVLLRKHSMGGNCDDYGQGDPDHG
jgi:hypothetical protein